MNKYILKEDEIETEYSLASFGSVIGATFIDILILLIYSLGCASVIGVIIMYMIFGLPFVYNKGEWGRGFLNSKAETWGHRIFKIKRINISSSSKIPEPYEFVRFLGLLFVILGFLPFFFTKKRQCIHDLLAGTIVVKINSHGVKKWKNGNIYMGELKNGMMHGNGVFTFSDGEKHEGLWEDDEFIEK